MKLSLTNISGRQTILLIVTTLFLLIALAATIFLVKQRQEIRKKAEVALICDPGPQRYDSDSVTVTNNTGSVLNLEIQENLCDYNGEGIPLPFGTECNQFFSRYPATVADGATVIFQMTVPDCKIGQIDIIPSGVGCYNNREDKPWEGGMAFALKANPTGYDPVTGTCPTPSPTATPTSVPPSPTPTVPTSTPTGTLTPTPTGTPTPPVGGQPTSTPTKTPTPTRTPTPPPGATYTPTSPPPVSGNIAPTIITAIGGIILLLVGLLL